MLENTVSLVFMVWHTEADQISGQVASLFFGKGKRRKLPEPFDIPNSDLRARRQILSKIASLFDPSGLLTPLIVPMCSSNLTSVKSVEWD